MYINNKIENAFNRNAIFAASVFFVVGVLIVLFNNFSFGNITFGSAILLVSCFVIFTFSGVEIDTEKNQVKQYNKLFGCVKTGKWKSLDNFRGVTIIPIRKVLGMASMSNRTTSSLENDFRIFLVNNNKKPAFAIKRCIKKEDAQNSLDEFSIWLKKPVFSVKK